VPAEPHAGRPVERGDEPIYGSAGIAAA